MTSIYYRRNQETPLDCFQLDSNFDALRERANATGTQLANTISNLYTTVKAYDFIADLQQCCEELTQAIADIQESAPGDISTQITNLRNELLQDIAEVQTDLDALTLRVGTAETNITTINSTLSSLSSSITGLANSKANIASPTFTGVPKAPTPLANADGTQIATVDYVNDYGTPIGVVLPYGGSSAPNSNWLLAQGQAVNRATYAALFSLFGTTYGVGDGTTTFNLPNLQQRVPVGVGSGYALGATGGSATHTLTTNEMPTHSHTADHFHTITDPGHSHNLDPYVQDSLVGNDFLNNMLSKESTGDSASTNSNTTGITQTNSASVTTSNQGSGQAHNNMQPYIVLNYIVKVK